MRFGSAKFANAQSSPQEVEKLRLAKTTFWIEDAVTEDNVLSILRQVKIQAGTKLTDA